MNEEQQKEKTNHKKSETKEEVGDKISASLRKAQRPTKHIKLKRKTWYRCEPSSGEGTARPTKRKKRDVKKEEKEVLRDGPSRKTRRKPEPNKGKIRKKKKPH